MNRGVLLVTGASGFVGGHLIERLTDDGHEVVGWTRSAAAPLAAAVTWDRVDLLDRERVRDAIRELRPRAVYHLAGVTHVGRSWSDPVRPLQGNVLATHHLLDAIRRAGAPCRVLITGSAAIYAPSTDPLSETSRLAPDSPYALSKLAQESLGLRALVEDGIEVVATRSFNHTGPRQSDAFVAPALARQIARIARGASPPVIRAGNLDARRDLTDVRDVVRAYAGLMASGVPGQVYNVASGIGHTVRAIVDTLARMAGVTVRIETDPARLRPVDNPILVGDARRLQALTGWAPRISFEEMLSDLLTYWRLADASAP